MRTAMIGTLRGTGVALRAAARAAAPREVMKHRGMCSAAAGVVPRGGRRRRRVRTIPSDGKTLGTFMHGDEDSNRDDGARVALDGASQHYLEQANMLSNERRTFRMETYGCQMNVSDSEVVRAVLLGAGYEEKVLQNRGDAGGDDDADVILLNTCAIRDKAEQRIWNRLRALRRGGSKSRSRATIGVLGCMAERLKTKLLEGEERSADLVMGPDAYRDLPRLLDAVMPSHLAGARVERTQEEGDPVLAADNINVQLSVDETYADIAPVRDAHSSVSAFTTIMRGCNNMCSFCIVPHVRGRERSRAAPTIIDEVRRLSEGGYKEVVLLGQNVNSYFDGKRLGRKAVREAVEKGKLQRYTAAAGFSNTFNLRDGIAGDGARFANLLAGVAQVDPEMRVRFTSPHPKDFPDEVLDVIAENPNICRGIHMPAQSGSNNMLKVMRRGHDRDAYLALIERFRARVPGVEFSSDFISGFCGETEEDHKDTLDLMRRAEFEQAFMFAYSMRARTHAWHRLEDDVPEDVKKRRLAEVVTTFRETALSRSKRVDKGQVKLVLAEKPSRRSSPENPQLTGRTETHKRCVFGQSAHADWDSFVRSAKNKSSGNRNEIILQKGDYVAVLVSDPAVTTLQSRALFRTSLQEFTRLKDSGELDKWAQQQR